MRVSLKHFLFSLLVVFFAGCAHPLLPPDGQALRAGTPDMNIADDGSAESLETILATSIEYLRSKTETENIVFPGHIVSAADYRMSLEALLATLKSDSSKALFLSTLEHDFEYYETYGDKTWTEMRAEAYQAPKLRGSLARTGEFSYPVYGTPKDLLRIRVDDYAAKFDSLRSLLSTVQESGRSDGFLYGRYIASTDPVENIGSVVPYYSREEIETKSLLQRRSGILVWLKPAEASLLQQSGFAAVELENGTLLNLAYDADNGRKILTAAPAPGSVSGSRYVFFRRSDYGLRTRLNAAFVPGRTAAFDYRYYPSGALALMSYDRTTAGTAKTETRLVGAHDYGVNLNPGTMKIYMGLAGEAGLSDSAYAKSRVYFLAPKESFLADLRKRALEGKAGLSNAEGK